MVMNMYFKRLSDLRIDKDKSQVQIAEYLKCNRQVYGRYERGDREIPISFLIKLADYYDVTIDYIVERTDSKK